MPVPFVDEHSAELIKRIYEVDPLVCPSCGAPKRKPKSQTAVLVGDSSLACGISSVV